jgi:hypothetical protein
MPRESVRLPGRRQAFPAAFMPTRVEPDAPAGHAPTLTLPRKRGREKWGRRSASWAAVVTLPSPSLTRGLRGRGGRGYRSGFQAIGIILLLATAFISRPAAALDLFAQHQVSVEFASADGKPLADAEVRVFAPGQPNIPVLTGHTDSQGKFEFPADEDGFWTAEARAGTEIARATVRVGKPGRQREPLSPFWLIGGLLLLLVLAFGVRVAFARRRRQPK